LDSKVFDLNHLLVQRCCICHSWWKSEYATGLPRFFCLEYYVRPYVARFFKPLDDSDDSGRELEFPKSGA